MTMKALVFAMSQEIEPVPKLILIYLAELSDQHGDSNRRHEDIAVFAGVSLDEVEYALTYLEAARLIHRRLASDEPCYEIIQITGQDDEY